MYKVGELVVLKKGLYFDVDMVGEVVQAINSTDLFTNAIQYQIKIRSEIPEKYKEIMFETGDVLGWLFDQHLKPLNEDFWNYIETGKLEE